MSSALHGRVFSVFYPWGQTFELRQVYGNLKVEVHSHSESGSEDAIAFSYIPKYLFYIVQDRWPFSNDSRRCGRSSRMDISLTFSPKQLKTKMDGS